MNMPRPAYCRCSLTPPGPAWLVLARAVRPTDGNVKIVAQRCWPLDGRPITSADEAIAAVQAQQLATFRRLLPGYEFSDWSARPHSDTAKSTARALAPHTDH